MRELPGYNPEQEQESEAARNARLAEGNITEDEIKAHWAHPDKPLFNHEIIRTDKEGKGYKK